VKKRGDKGINRPSCRFLCKRGERGGKETGLRNDVGNMFERAQMKRGEWGCHKSFWERGNVLHLRKGKKKRPPISKKGKEKKGGASQPPLVHLCHTKVEDRLRIGGKEREEKQQKRRIIKRERLLGSKECSPYPYLKRRGREGASSFATE